MTHYTELADEAFAAQDPPKGVRVRRLEGRIPVTQVDITQSGLAQPPGRYITIEAGSLAAWGEQNTQLVETAAQQLGTLLPRQGPVLVVGVGNRRVTADALGPCTVGRVLVSGGRAALRTVYAIAPGTGGETGIPLQEAAAALAARLKPAAVLCVDSLCGGAPERLGRTVQFSNGGLSAAHGRPGAELTEKTIGVPVIAAGIPTLMDAEALTGTAGLTVTPRQLDDVIDKGSRLLAAAINRALQPGFSQTELRFLVG